MLQNSGVPKHQSVCLKETVIFTVQSIVLFDRGMIISFGKHLHFRLQFLKCGLHVFHLYKYCKYIRNVTP